MHDTHMRMLAPAVVRDAGSVIEGLCALQGRRGQAPRLLRVERGACAGEAESGGPPAEQQQKSFHAVRFGCARKKDKSCPCPRLSSLRPTRTAPAAEIHPLGARLSSVLDAGSVPCRCGSGEDESLRMVAEFVSSPEEDPELGRSVPAACVAAVFAFDGPDTLPMSTFPKDDVRALLAQMKAHLLLLAPPLAQLVLPSHHACSNVSCAFADS